MSTDPIVKSGLTCPYSTLPELVRATRLLLGTLPAVAFATALAGCQLVPTEFDRRIEPEDPNPKSILSTICGMKEDRFHQDILLSNVAIGRISNNKYHQDVRHKNGLSEFEVYLTPPYFWGISNVKPGYQAIDGSETYQESLDRKDIVISVNILTARNHKSVKFESITENRKMATIYVNKEVFLNYNLIDFRNNQIIEGVFLKSYYEKSENGKRKLYSIGQMLSDLDSARSPESLKAIDELQAFEASYVVVSVWDIIDHFLNGPSEEKGIRKIEGERQKVFRYIDDKSEDVADRIFNCKNNRYFMSGTNSSDESILNPDDLMKRIVHIETPNEIGTGFYVDDNLVMTNYHVIDDSFETHRLPILRINKFGKDDEFGGIVVAYDRWRDLALLSVEEAETSFPIDAPPKRIDLEHLAHRQRRVGAHEHRPVLLAHLGLAGLVHTPDKQQLHPLPLR